MLENYSLIPTLPIMEYFAFSVSLFAITDPVGFVPVFLDLTKDYSQKKRNSVIVTAFMAMFIALTTAIWFGEIILHFFHITIGDFQISGGIILLLLGLSMMRRHGVETHDLGTKKNIAVVPLAIPLVAGPGTFTMILVETHKHDTLADKLIINLDVLVIVLAIAAILYYAPRIFKFIGETGIEVATKIMGMIVMAESVEMLTQGLYKNYQVIQGL